MVRDLDGEKKILTTQQSGGRKVKKKKGGHEGLGKENGGVSEA